MMNINEVTNRAVCVIVFCMTLSVRPISFLALLLFASRQVISLGVMISKKGRRD